MPRRTMLVRLLKGCYLGNEGMVVRLDSREALKACEKGLARVHEWRPPVRKVTPDVLKGATNGA